MASKFRNDGQTCDCANWFNMQGAVYDKFADKLAARLAEMTVGGGLDGAHPGPLIEPAAVAKVAEHIGDAIATGGIAQVGGAPQDMKAAKAETFGPLAPLFRLQDVDDVIAMTNDTIFRPASSNNRGLGARGRTLGSWITLK